MDKNAENQSKIGVDTENNVGKDIFEQDYIEVEDPKILILWKTTNRKNKSNHNTH